ncbi:hypothetical protein [Candidatus Methanodesulfokora washburnensis]|uniref:Uncharacterized protein n=1 Tax=Candidatus Methanodesulfokora washburnensis TaxID=2478471 RepID=A0A3R9QBI0_9CREN|nr:hypothetical protein [Candidatus Methanodesulfokores washburnensis]RSN72474.1 hypothetical protein D6D85_13770 [Candidatus Methanodesulfokores washburnensis]
MREIVEMGATISDEIPLLKLMSAALPVLPDEVRPYATAYVQIEMDEMKDMVLRIQHLFLAIAEMDVHLPLITEEFLRAFSAGDYRTAVSSLEKLVSYVYDVLYVSILEKRNIALQTMAAMGREEVREEDEQQ